MPDTNALTERLKAAIRATGLRATRGRMAVLDAVQAVDGPISHPELVDRLAGFDRATVYRNLMDLTRVGLLRRFDVDHIWRFEAQQTEAHTDEHGHAHFVCTDCGKVECLPEVDVNIPTRSTVPASVARQLVEVQLRGVCDVCT